MKKFLSLLVALPLFALAYNGAAFAQTASSTNASTTNMTASSTPGIPTTGAGGYAPAIFLIAILAGATAITGATMVRRG